MRVTLTLAGAYNLLWGAFVVLFPGAAFAALGMDSPRYPAIWQCVGMIVGVYGVGYLVAARAPLRHWPIVLVGFLGKIFGPIGFIQAAWTGQLPWVLGFTIITNDLIWWIPFGVILWRALDHANEQWAGGRATGATFEETIQNAATQRGDSLAVLSRRAPTLVVFLRHAGCAFCREAMADLARTRPEIERRGVRIAIVHQSEEEPHTRAFFERYGLEDVARISDPNRRLYQAFDLKRGSLRQLFGITTWLRGAIVGVLKGHGVGALRGDGFQMPGVFLLHDGRIMQAQRHRSAADRPDYADIAACPLPTTLERRAARTAPA